MKFKTDWKNTDYFTAMDYNRIGDNLKILKAKHEKIYEPFVLKNIESKVIGDYLLAGDMNILSEYIIKLFSASRPSEKIELITYEDGGKTMTADDLNMLEEYIRVYADKINSQLLMRRKFRFNFVRKGVKNGL